MLRSSLCLSVFALACAGIVDADFDSAHPKSSAGGTLSSGGVATSAGGRTSANGGRASGGIGAGGGHLEAGAGGVPFGGFGGEIGGSGGLGEAGGGSLGAGGVVASGGAAPSFGGASAGGRLASGGASAGGAANGGASVGLAGAGGEAGAESGCRPGPGEEVRHPVYGCGRRITSPNEAGAWVAFESGLQVDELTGLGWTRGNGSRNQSEAMTYCESLVLAGLADWKLPTIDQTRTLAAGCPATVSTGTCTLSDPNCLERACGTGAKCKSCIGREGPNNGSYCREIVQICTSLNSTSSSCSDCVGLETMWGYGVGNGNVVPLSRESRYTHVCVLASVPKY